MDGGSLCYSTKIADFQSYVDQLGLVDMGFEGILSHGVIWA